VGVRVVLQLVARVGAAHVHVDAAHVDEACEGALVQTLLTTSTLTPLLGLMLISQHLLTKAAVTERLALQLVVVAQHVLVALTVAAVAGVGEALRVAAVLAVVEHADLGCGSEQCPFPHALKVCVNAQSSRYVCVLAVVIVHCVFVWCACMRRERRGCSIGRGVSTAPAGAWC
jgi:hypothetical protein